MPLSLLIAWRYLFAKRSTNAINIITGISVLGVAIGTAALLLVLSVFNGFEDLLSGLFGHFNPEIKIEAARGKQFEPDSLQLARLRALPEVWVLSETLEEIAFFEYDGSQDFGVIKGVDGDFARVTGIDSTLREGAYVLEEDGRQCAVLGAGVRNKLSVNVENFAVPMMVYMPETAGGATSQPYKSRLLYPKGTFAIQQDYDNQYILTNLGFMRELLGVSANSVSALELKCRTQADLGRVKRAIADIMGPGFKIRDSYEQNEAFFKVMNLEKWMGFAITSLMLVLMAFNTLGALWMIVLDKQKDISILKSMGAADAVIRMIFLLEGLLLTLLGMTFGFLLAFGLYGLQKNYGIISIPEGFLVNSYPIAMRAGDFLPVMGTVITIGLLASLAPARRAVLTPSYVAEE